MEKQTKQRLSHLPQTPDRFPVCLLDGEERIRGEEEHLQAGIKDQIDIGYWILGKLKALSLISKEQISEFENYLKERESSFRPSE